jgi:hypothetical protein
MLGFFFRLSSGDFLFYQLIMMEMGLCNNIDK